MKNRKVTQLFAGLMVTALVLTGGVVPPTTSMAATKTVTIKTQEQLQEALKNPKVTSIIIKTSKGTTFTIKDRDYSTKKLIVSAPKAKINNAGDFKNIEIRDGKAFTDKGNDNNVIIKDKNTLKFVVAKKANDVKITVSGKNGKINIVTNGDVDAINVKNQANVTVNGSSTNAPVITNNAEGATIIVSKDAIITLNKSADLTISAGTKLGSLEVKANASVIVEKGAEIKNISVTGDAKNVALSVDGAVTSVSVDTKASISVAGNTTETVAITSNAEGAAITSAVKSDVKLNANASVSLGKGAEGSTVKAEKDGVKPAVDNKTADKVTVIDSTGKSETVEAGKTSTGDSTTIGGGGSTGGSSSGGSSTGGSGSGGSSSGGSTTEDKKVKFNVSVDGEGALDQLKAGIKLKAAATTDADQSAVFTYEWKVGDTVVSTSDTYTIKAEDAGKVLTVTAAATINGKKETFTHSPFPVIKAEYHSNSYIDPAISVANGTTEAEVVKQLPEKITIYDANKINVAEVAVTWTAATKYQSETAGTYMFSGAYQLPETWTGVNPQLTAKVTVLQADALKYTVSVAKGFTHNEDDKKNSTLTETKENQNAVTLKGTGYDYTIVGSLNALHSFASSNVKQGKGKWIGLLIDVGKDIKDQLYFGSEKENLSDGNKITVYEDQVANHDQVILWVKADQLAKDGAITRYMKYGADGTIVPLTIRFENTDVQISRFDSVSDINGGTYGNVTAKDDLKLPETVTAYDSKGGKHTVKVTWAAPDTYKADAAAGSYRFTAKLAEGETVVVPENVQLPVANVVIAKAENVTCSAPTVNESKTTATSITLNAVTAEGETVEYACAETKEAPTDGWQEAVTFDHLQAGNTYYFFARAKADENHNAGAASEGVEAATSQMSVADITAMTETVHKLYVAANWEGVPSQVSAYGSPVFTADSNNATKINVTGALNYIEGFKGFNSAVEAEQSGHYLAIQFAAPKDADIKDVVVACGNKTFGADTFDQVEGAKIFSLLIHLSDQGSDQYQITIDWDGTNGTKYAETTYTLDLTKLTKNLKATAEDLSKDNTKL